jgi:hypothetical protein
MKTFLMLLWVWLLPAVGHEATSSTAPALSYDALVVVHITGLNDASLAQLSKLVGRDKSVSMEYSCAWSGVVVLKFTDIAVSERADVIQLARRQLSSAGIEQGVEFLHVHAEPRGTGKC